MTMTKELMVKLVKEAPLTEEESLALDRALAGMTSPRLVSALPDPVPSMAWRSELNQKLARADELPSMAPLLTALPTDEPSLAWRSQLNEKLVAVSGRQKKRTRFVWFGALAGPVAAAAIGILMLSPQFDSQRSSGQASAPMAQSSGLEQDLVNFHSESEAQTALRVSLPSEVGSSGYDWSELGSM